MNSEQWQVAQDHEIQFLCNETIVAKNYQITLIDFFKLPEDFFINKTILEVGGGDYPICGCIPHFKRAINIEPLWNKFSEDRKKWTNSKGIESIGIPFEDYEPKEIFDEIFFFNTLQHVDNPILLLEKAKKCGKIIRVFEPINWPTCAFHLHMLTIELFRSVFPDANINIYKGGSFPNWHESDCVWFEYLTSK